MLHPLESQVLVGDCLTVLKQFQPGSVDLAYLDPPFFTNKTHRLVTRDRSRAFSYDDLWNSNREYTDFLLARLDEIHRVLADTGALFFHCDRNATHIVRALLDEVFGAEAFRSEIVWHYRRWSNASRALLPSHQTIYYYTKSDNFTFNTLWEDYSPSTNVDQILQQRVRDEFGKSVYCRDASGDVVTNGGKRGVPLSDVWDIPYLNPKARERTGYPTQKPVLLLERIIRLASNEGDTVLDPFCGSGTALVAAAILGRAAIGVDVSEDAVQLALERLKNPQKTDSNLLAQGRGSYQNADPTVISLLRGLQCVPVHRNKGMDAILKEDIQGTPIPVRVQRPGETIVDCAEMLYRACRNKQVRLMFVVRTSMNRGLSFVRELPDGVVVVDAPGLAIQEHVRAERTRLDEEKRDKQPLPC
jgi:site-specific DNA-methyltransferase (adenine-specific)